MANRVPLILLELMKELLWWLIFSLIAIAVMYPITRHVQYVAIYFNGILLVIAMQYFRYAIYLRTVAVLRSKWVRFAVFVFNINFFVWVLRQQQYFMSIYDSFAIEDLGKPLHPIAAEQVYPLFQYFYSEITMAVMACLLLAVALNVRMIGAYWGSARLRLNAGDEE